MGVWTPGPAATGGADTYTGDNTAETVDGLAGGDTLTMLGGDDFAVGGEGADNISGGEGNDILHGDSRLLDPDTGAFADTINGGAGNDIIAGGGGNDTLAGGDGDDIVFSGRLQFIIMDEDSHYSTAGGGHDIMDGGDGEDVAVLALSDQTGAIVLTMNAAAATSTYTVGGVASGASLTGFESLVIHSGSGADTIHGTSSWDLIDGGAGNDMLYGEGGDDVFMISEGVDLLFGGDGQDGIEFYEITTGATIDLGLTTQQQVGNRFYTLNSIENVDSGTLGNDIIYGTEIGQFLSGNDGDDLLEGRGGDDELEGDEGADTMLGGAGADQLWIDVFDTARGGADDDTYHVFDPNSLVAIDEAAGEGRDTVRYYNDDIQPNLISLSIENVANVERVVADYAGTINITGNGLDNELIGNNLANILTGLGGIDVLQGMGGDDTLLGGLGNDTLFGGEGNDVLAGHEGDDTLDGGVGFGDSAVYQIAASGVTVSLTVAGPQATGGAGTDTLIGIENLIGSAFTDTLTGNGGNNFFNGNAGDDFIAGGAGGDTLNGGLGEDQLYGQGGNDTLRDGGETTNRDYMYGGAGNDTYYVNSSLTGPLDLVFEGGTNPDLMAGVGDVDVIRSEGEFFWDYYGVAETLYIDRTAGGQIVGGTNSQTFFGGAGSDQIIAYGGSNRVDGGAGSDAVSFGLYGLDESFDGVNTLVMKAGNGLDYVYDFESGVDKVDLSAFGFGITGAQVLAQAVNVDQAGTANDYCYFYLTSAGGVDNFVVFMGLLSNQLSASDFIT